MDTEEVSYSYEYWDCSCGTKGLRGDVVECPGCGHPRDAHVKFYRKLGVCEAVEPEKLARFESGPDWVCSFCQDLNSSLDKQCRGCQHPRESKEKNYFENIESQGAHRKHFAEEAAARDALSRKRSTIVAAFLAVLTLSGFGWWALSSRPVDYQVTSVHWQRIIPIQRYQWFQREDWRDGIRGDGVIELSSNREIRRYDHRQVGARVEHYTDTESYCSGSRDEVTTSYQSLGNGAGRTVTSHHSVPVYSTRTVDRTRIVPVYQDFPIYDDKVRYKAKAYQDLRSCFAESDDNKPFWPRVELDQGVDKKPDIEGGRRESYTVILSKCKLRDNGPLSQTLNPDASDFTQKYLLGKRIRYVVNNLGQVTSEAADSVSDRGISRGR